MHVNVPNGTRPEGTGHFFQLVDDRTHHRARASGDGASWKHGLERRCTGFIVVKLGGDVADEMLHVGVGLNVKPVHVDGAGRATFVRSLRIKSTSIRCSARSFWSPIIVSRKREASSGLALEDRCP